AARADPARRRRRHASIAVEAGPGRWYVVNATRYYTHLNNTNPLIRPDDAGHRRLAEAGIRVAAEGALIEL
ncbi:hypothetical protein, partial [Spirillospora sp. NPDC029432]|uniref:hypothetical protein n=1 Tax=Spirillospora sp. NPDC029432 TaxID=3154599 RepID=UPI003455B0DF